MRYVAPAEIHRAKIAPVESVTNCTVMLKSPFGMLVRKDKKLAIGRSGDIESGTGKQAIN
jgi:hypothetical protein